MHGYKDPGEALAAIAETYGIDSVVIEGMIGNYVEKPGGLLV